MGKYVLGVDIGSGSVKLTLLSFERKVTGTAGAEYPTFYPQVGYSEQNAEDWCTAFKKAFSELLIKTAVLPAEIEALAVDAATHTAVLLDENIRPIRNAILWTDQRSVEEVAFLSENYGELIHAQVMNAPTTVWTLPQFMWLKKHEPEVWSRIRHILFAKDYLRYRFTGTLETDYIDAMGSMFYDAVEQRWSEELMKVGDIDPAWLPKVCAPEDVAGYVTEAAAKEFNLSVNTRVLVGTTDTVMEVLAAGSVKPGNGTVKLATAGRICVITDQPIDSPFVFNYRHVVRGLWYPGTASASCANSYRWYRDAIGFSDYEDLNRGAETIPVGSDGLMFHPYINGELTPYNDPLLKGSYTGISARHTKAHFTRATLEGVAFSLKDCLATAQGLGMKMNRVRIIGGGAKGLLWRQIVTDILGMPMEKNKIDDSSFGTAMLAAVGIGWAASYEEITDSCIEVDSVTEPVPENCEKYEAIFEKYKLIHDALAPIYRMR